VSFCTLLAILATGVSAGERPQAIVEPLVSKRPVDRPPARVVIRFSEQLFQTPRRAKIDEVTRVSERINGVLNTGTAHTVGNLVPDLKEKRDGIGMTLIFSGTTTSSTVGQKGQVQIVDRTASDFRVEIPLEFDLENGFSAGEISATATVVDTCKDVCARRAGLLAPLARATALNRMRKQSVQIRRESETLTERRMAEESKARVAEELNAWNDRWGPLLKGLQQQTGNRAERPVRFSTTEEELILTIDPGVRQTSPVARTSNEERATELKRAPELPERNSASLVDVIVYDDYVAVMQAALILKFVERIIKPDSEKLWKIERLDFETQQGEEWVMFSALGVDLEEEPEVAQATNGPR
jgi:hypothetical protein